MVILTLAFLATTTALPEPMAKAGINTFVPARPLPLDPPPPRHGGEPPYEGALTYQGMRINIENAAGSTRRGTAPDGTPWATTMTDHYGEFADTIGTDGDAVDVFVGPDPQAPMAYVIHTKHPGTEVYDEDKVVIGVRTGREAEALLRANYNSPGRIAGVTPWPIAELREYLAHPGHEGKRLDQPERVRLMIRPTVSVPMEKARPTGKEQVSAMHAAAAVHVAAHTAKNPGGHGVHHVDAFERHVQATAHAQKLAAHITAAGGPHANAWSKEDLPGARVYLPGKSYLQVDHTGAISEHGYSHPSGAWGKAVDKARAKYGKELGLTQRDWAPYRELRDNGAMLHGTDDLTDPQFDKRVLQHAPMYDNAVQMGFDRLAKIVTTDEQAEKILAYCVAAVHPKLPATVKLTPEQLADDIREQAASPTISPRIKPCVRLASRALSEVESLAENAKTINPSGDYYRTMGRTEASQVAEIALQRALHGRPVRPIDRLEDELRKGRRYPLLKATIRTPMTKEGKVNYEAVPTGSTIWVTVKDPHSPMHGRAIMLTKRPDGGMALTGGSGAKHILARKHLVVSGGRPKTTEADEAKIVARQEAEKNNAPVRERVKALQKEANAAKKTAEDKFMSALGIEKRGLNKEQKAAVYTAALDHATAQGFTGRDAETFAKHMSDGIARKERELRIRQAAHRLDHAAQLVRGADADEATAIAGAEPKGMAYAPPAIDPTEWKAMSPEQQEAAVHEHLDQQEQAQRLDAIDAQRFEDDPDEPAPTADTLEPQAPAAPAPTTGDGPQPPSEAPAAVPTDAPAPDTGSPHEASAEAMAATDSGPTDTSPPEHLSHPAFATGDAPAAEPRPSPFKDADHAQAAIDAFREYAQAQKASKEVASTITKIAGDEPASATSLEALRLHVGDLDDDQMRQAMSDYVEQNGRPPDTGFYDALSPHWNDTQGNKLAGAVTKGAASAITGLVGEVGARIDVQRLVDALGPEAAAVAVIHRMKDELGEKFPAWVEKLKQHNAVNQQVTENQALRRHHELLKQHADLEKQVGAGDLTATATIEVLRARNLLEQRENLGGALGSMQASAALYHFADQAQGQKFKKQDITVNVGSKAACDDKLKRLGKFGGTAHYHPTLGYQIKTDSQQLRKYVGKTEQDQTAAKEYAAIKYNTAGVEPDDEGREWVPSYKVPGFRSHFGDESSLPLEQKHLAGKPINMMVDQRNNIEWLDKSGGGLVTMRTGGGKTLVSAGVAAKSLARNPKGMHLRVVPDGRESQWAQEVQNFTNIHTVVLPAQSTKEQRAQILAQAPPGSMVIVGHSNAGKYDHKALAETHKWATIGIDEPQELRAKSGSGKLGVGAKRIMKIEAENRHAMTATPATDHPVEAYDIVNWANPGALGYRTRFRRAFDGFGGGTNAQDAALSKMMYRELEPHVSGERLTPPHYGITHKDHTVNTSPAQLGQQRQIEGRVEDTIKAAVADAYAKKADGRHGYADRSHGTLKKEATEKAMAKLEREHRMNMSAGDLEHNPKLQALKGELAKANPDHRHVIFVDSPEQRKSVTAMLEAEHGKGKVKNITASAKNDTVKVEGVDQPAIEQRKRDWKTSKGGFLLIDRSSASGHNLAEGDHLHVLGNPDDAAQLLQAHGRLGRSNRVGDFKISTYKYGDSPFEHHQWNKLERQMKVLRATAPGMFVEGKKPDQAEPAPARAMAKARILVRSFLRRIG